MKALIVGAGIGGLTTAVALAQAGVEPIVAERARTLSDLGAGAGLTLQMNAMHALGQLDLADQVQAAGMVGEVSEFRNWKGSLLAQWSEREIGERLGALTVHISRAALHPVLSAAAPADCLWTGLTLSSLRQDDTGVTAAFEDGTTQRVDFLVGADGLNSTVRSELKGPEDLRYAGYSVWRGVTKFDAPGLPSGIFRMCWGRGRRFCIYQVADGILYWFGVEDSSADRVVSQGQRKAAVLDAFRGWMDPIEALVDATPEAAIHLTPIYDRPPATSWGRGRVTLLGDAAHPMTFNLGQGACQAIEDAVVLANAVRAEGDDVEAALRRYEARRIQRTATMTTRSWRIGRLGRIRNPAACAARNTLMRLVFERFVVRGQAKSMIVDLSA